MDDNSPSPQGIQLLDYEQRTPALRKTIDHLAREASWTAPALWRFYWNVTRYV